ncbi:ileal sodium/bile acid cotransporter-like [Mytilus californianus]|uniref:ileal sodium/bile acid cotransporter-like n=1 Tax=Mytilus californianus TaxID=6549 RepID=UPI002247BCA6|nr:ileal sodium/bile acid cotransporter-like [Mytilus californianus]
METTGSWVNMFDNMTSTQNSGSYNVTADLMAAEDGDPTKRFIKKTSDILMIVILAVILMSLGCTIEPTKLLQQIKKPVPVIIGMVLQFIVYPLTAFGFAHAFQLNKYDALGLLILATCPGGSLSNLITFYSSGDVCLSVCMTTFATTVAIGMMPLNLWVYSRSFITSTLTVPYVIIVISLVTILVPVAIGMVILKKLPKLATYILKAGGVLGMLFIVIILAINMYLYPGLFSSDWKMILLAIVLPCFGLSVGYAGSRIACLSHKQCRTIGIEVSSQNVALSTTLIYLSFETDDATKIVVFSLIFGVFSVTSLTIFTLLYRIYINCVTRKKKSLNENESKEKKENIYQISITIASQD